MIKDMSREVCFTAVPLPWCYRGFQSRRSIHDWASFPRRGSYTYVECPLSDAECSPNDAECSLNDDECSLNDAECSLNDIPASRNRGNAKEAVPLAGVKTNLPRHMSDMKHVSLPHFAGVDLTTYFATW